MTNADLTIDGGSDWVECVSFSLFTVASLVLMVLFGFLLSVQIKKYGLRDGLILKKVKTWIFIFAILMITFIFFDDLIMPTAMKWVWTVFISGCIGIFRQLTALTLF